VRRAAAAALAALALAGCGSSKLPPPAAEPAVSPPPGERPTGRVVRVGSAPEGVIADPVTGLVAVGLRNPDELALVDGRSGRVVRRVRLPESPRHLALEAPGGPVLVPAERANALVRVALPGGRVESVTRVGRFPHDAAASGGRLLVGNEFGNNVSVVAGTHVIATLAAPLQPGGVAPLPGGLAAVVAVRARVLALYRLDPPRLVAKVDIGVGPTHVAGALGRLYVADTEGDAVLGLRLSPRLEINGRANAPGSPYGIAADERRHRLYVTLTARNTLVEYALGGPAPRQIAAYPTVRQPNSVAVDPRDGRVFVASRTDGTLELIDPIR
jgi:DNA-binding beta-propeller fold protein YncE